jgi:NAD(P)-dependent dehydrogenase (short-subunit alcohol dehydrogenase family)
VATGAFRGTGAHFARPLVREWARRGIAVNALAPGYIETEINAKWWPTEGGQSSRRASRAGG